MSYINTWWRHGPASMTTGKGKETFCKIAEIASPLRNAQVKKTCQWQVRPPGGGPATATPSAPRVPSPRAGAGHPHRRPLTLLSIIFKSEMQLEETSSHFKAKER